jgi:hypothetical protein
VATDSPSLFLSSYVLRLTSRGSASFQASRRALIRHALSGWGGAPLDIVHRRTPENVDRLLALLLGHGAYHRLDLANRRLPPTRDALLGRGHVNLAVRDAKLDVLCEIEQDAGYEEIIKDTEAVPFHSRTLRVLGLQRLIQAKAAAGRPKDHMVIPILVATLEAAKSRK